MPQKGCEITISASLALQDRVWTVAVVQIQGKPAKEFQDLAKMPGVEMRTKHKTGAAMRLKS
jgi:hypothetical protein